MNLSLDYNTIPFVSPGLVVKDTINSRLNLLPPLSESVIFLELNMVDTVRAKMIKETFMLSLLSSGLD